MSRHRISAQIAPQIMDWLRTRGGVQVWVSRDLATPGREWMTPLLGPAGKSVGKPHYSTSGTSEKTLTKPEDFEVVTGKEVRRFKIAVQARRGGMLLVLTDASDKKVRKALEKAGEESWHEFDGDQAVIMVPDEVKPMEELFK